jgi:gluconokinase
MTMATTRVGHAGRAMPLIVVMGVSGSGKTTLAEALAAAKDFALIEADKHHSATNRSHMAAGRPLTDAMREPFVASLCEAIRAEDRACVIAFSALRRAHRARIRALGRPTLFLHLVVDPRRIASRLRERREHFMPPALLESQLAAMESAHDEADVQVLVANDPAPRVYAEAALRVEQFLRDPGSGSVLDPTIDPSHS